nr:hypothetical protein [uncultured bacterium]
MNTMRVRTKTFNPTLTAIFLLNAKEMNAHKGTAKMGYKLINARFPNPTYHQHHQDEIT